MRGITKDATEDEVCQHFESFGVVSDCVVVKDIGKVMGTRMQRSKLLSKLVTMKIDAAYYEAKGRRTIGALQKKRIDKQKERIIKCDEKIQNKLAKGFDSVCAFVTFEEPKCRADAAKAYSRGTYLCGCLQSEDLKFRGKHVLKLKRAPESSDMLWENVLRVHPVVRITRKMIALTCIFILLLGAIGIVVYAKDSLAKSPPSVVCTSTVVDPVENPAPNLECAAIWPLLAEDANVNTASPARRSVKMFVDNVDHNKCGGFIAGNEWAKPMSIYSPFDGAKLANLPGAADPWQGGWIKETQADECAALTCLKCYCTSIVSFANVQDIVKAYVNSRKDGAGDDLCSDIFDQLLLEAGVQLGTIAVTALTNVVLMASAEFFSRFERHETLSDTEANGALYIFLALFVNQALVPVIIYSFIEILEGFPVLFQGTFTDFESGWYNKVMVMLLASAIINAVSFPLARSAPAILGGLRRTLTGCCAHSQRALNKLHMPPKFELSQRYGQILCVMFYTMIFFAAAPPLFPLAAVLFFLMYAVDKTLLLKYSRRPPMYDYKLNDLFLSYAPYACWFHLAVATWAFGHHQIPSYIIDPADAVPGNNQGASFIASVASQAAQATGNATDTTTDYSGKPDQFDVMNRLVRANALLPFVFFVALTVSLFLSKILGSAAEVCAAACCQREEKVDEDVAPFSTLALPGDARHDDPGTHPDNKLSGLRSYRIEDNPEYMMLFPEVLDAGHG